jgi:hypothetical protein
LLVELAAVAVETKPIDKLVLAVELADLGLQLKLSN